MPPPPTPAEESFRLDALWRAGILDTREEDFFEDVVDLLKSAVAAPYVLVSLVDEGRLWFKAKRGFVRTEVPREAAISTHAILSDAPLVLNDIRKDARFRDTPFVAGTWNVVSYAGAPIVLSGGARIGAVCAADTTPRDWSAEEVRHLQRGARMVARHIDARRAELEKDRQRFLELALAHAEVRYESVIQTMSEGMVVLGPSGAIIDSNPAASDILGLSGDEVFGRNCEDPRWRIVLPSGDDNPATVTLRTGQPQRDVVLSIETPRGERRWLLVNTYPVRHSGNERVDQVVAVFQRTGAPEGAVVASPAPSPQRALR